MNTSNDQLIKNLINDSYFHKWVIDPDEPCLQFWTHWADQNPEREGSMIQARAILLSYQFKSHSVSERKTSELWTQIADRIERPNSNQITDQEKSVRNWWYGNVAAAVLMIATFFAYNGIWNKSVDTTNPEITLVEKVAPEGKISSFKFEDGTTLKLFSGSVIRYPETFGAHSREVYLEGEGFFEVTRDSHRPFTVNTNTLKTTALGTSFNIRTYQNNTKCDVSLVTGKVKVETLKDNNGMVSTLFLEPGEEAIMEFEDVLKRPFNIEETISWKDGYVYLENKNFDETISILKRWFNVDFVVKNRSKVESKLKEKRGIGTFKNQSLENILRVIGHSYEFEYEIQHETVILTF